MKTSQVLSMMLFLVVLLVAGCSEVRVTSDQQRQIKSLRAKHTDEEISSWSGDRLLREMKAVNAAENAWDNMPTLEYSELLDMSSDEAGQAALEGYLENLPAILRYTTTEAEKAFIVEEGGRRLLYSLDDTLRRNPKLLLATEDEVAAAMSEAAKPLSDLMGDEILARFRLPVLRVEDDAI